MYPKRRRIEQRFLRSNGKPNFSDRIYRSGLNLKLISTKPVYTLSQTAPILEAVKTILNNGFRRLPITMPDKTLIGFATATDLVNYFGGGEYFQIVVERHNGDLYSSLNEPVESIMNRQVVKSHLSESLTEVLEKMVMNNVGAVVVVDDEEKVEGIITERDILRHMAGKLISKSVKEIMTRDVITASPENTLREAAETMINVGFRRLPIVSGSKLVGIVVATDIVKQFDIKVALEHSPRGSIYDIIKIPLSKFMVERVYTIHPDAELGEAAALMKNRNVGALPVVENGELKGIITERDLIYDLVLESSK